MKLYSIYAVLAGSILALTLCAEGASYTVVTGEHVDLQLSVSGGLWGSTIHPDSGSIPRDAGLLWDTDIGYESPGGSKWAFLGVGAGDPIYIFTQSQFDGHIFLGFGSDDGAIPVGTFAAYYESDPRVAKTARWNKISLVGMRFMADPADSATNTAQFSLWQTGGALGGPESGTSIWMSTVDGIAANDATWLVEGGHSHYNWGFSRKGYYQLDFRFSGFLSGTNSFSESPIYTFHFGVDYLPPAIPEPQTLTLLGAAGVFLLSGRRRRCNFSGSV